MPQWLKALLLFLGVGVLALAALVETIAWWMTSNKDRVLELERTARVEGEAFGKTHAKSQCLDDSLARLDGCGVIDFVCEARLSFRIEACLPVARDDGMCKGAPPRTEIVKRGNEECARRGHAGSQTCARLLQAVVEACAK